MANNDAQNITSNQVKRVPNPTGKGGFGDRPQDINRDGHWNPRNTFSYQMNKFKNMTIAGLEDWNKNTPKNVRTVAEDLAYRRIYNAQNKLDEFKEVADRTEGKSGFMNESNLIRRITAEEYFYEK